jgi:tetratricopeptide (TPR) repeat protein
VRIRHLGCIAALAAFSLSTAAAAAQCQLQQIGALPVDMQGSAPFVWTKINGVKARFELDSGSFYSTMWRDAAVQFQLPITPLRGGNFQISGTGGRERAEVATAESFEFLGVPLSKVQFLVIDQGLGIGSVGLIGQNLLRISDVEYDLANGIVRFFKPVGCERQPLAYWAVNTPYSAVELQSTYAAQWHLSATATINGHRITVWFDTGAPRSVLSLQAAERAGITPNSPGVTYLGLVGGIGPASNRTWSAPVDTFQLGGEKVQHAHLLIANLEPQHEVGDLSYGMPDMLLGDDFFLSHRVYVAYSQKKLYFTYNGGPLFNLNIPQVASGAAEPPASPGATSQAGATAGQEPASDTPTDADGFRRRGMAYASMREFDRALADLTRACQLAPRDTEARYDRGAIYAKEGRFKSALEDFDAAITLQPDDIDARLARVQLLQSHPDADPTGAVPEAKSDLDAVSQLVAPAASVRLVLGQLYGSIGDYSAAIDQFNQWLSHHPLKNDQATGLNERCWLRATANRDLHEALDDCNHALDLRPYAPESTGTLIRTPLASQNPDILDSRALVYLRLGSPKDAIVDYSSALNINPNMASSLYGRGLAELRLGEKAQGQNDLAAAKKLDSGVVKRFANMGLTP